MHTHSHTHTHTHAHALSLSLIHTHARTHTHTLSLRYLKQIQARGWVQVLDVGRDIGQHREEAFMQWSQLGMTIDQYFVDCLHEMCMSVYSGRA
jgi:hypothetical protein